MNFNGNNLLDGCGNEAAYYTEDQLMDLFQLSSAKPLFAAEKLNEPDQSKENFRCASNRPQAMSRDLMLSLASSVLASDQYDETVHWMNSFDRMVDQESDIFEHKA